MSTHRSTIIWKRTSEDFAYETYSRDHDWTFGGGARLEASAAPEYKGSVSRANPEEALVGALSSCHMLTFLAVCARKKIVVDSYTDAAEGYLEKNAAGRLAVTRVVLRPKVTFAGDRPSSADLAKLHESAHHGCFIAASVTTAITIEPEDVGA